MNAMNRPNPFAVAVVSGVLGALACLGTLGMTSETPDPVQECVYAVVRDFPTYKGTEPIGDTHEACKGLSEPQKAEVGEQLADFIDKSLETLNS